MSVTKAALTTLASHIKKFTQQPSSYTGVTSSLCMYVSHSVESDFLQPQGL